MALGVILVTKRNEYQGYFLVGIGSLVHTADNLTTFVCQSSWNVGASAYWKPRAFSRRVMGLLNLSCHCVVCFHNLTDRDCSTFFIFQLSYMPYKFFRFRKTGYSEFYTLKVAPKSCH